MMHLVEAYMKRLNFIVLLAIFLAGCASGPAYNPSYGGDDGGYAYQPPPQNHSMGWGKYALDLLPG
jgi:hypothetical protein